MKDHEGFLPKGWMMHEPYNLHNGTPALAIYTYLFRTTKPPSVPPVGGSNGRAWEGTLQTLADIVEIPIRTIRANLNILQSRGLVSIEPLAYSHYSIKAQRLTSKDPEVGISGQVVGISGTEVGISGQPLKDNININKNINQLSRSSIGTPSTAAAPSKEVILDRKSYIAKVLSCQIPEYPYAVVYEYAQIVNIPQTVVDDFLSHYASTGWKMGNGGKIVNWAAALRNWNVRAKRFEQEDAAKTRAAKTIVGYQAGQQMSDRNREIFEQEQERKKREKEQREKESEETMTYEEYLALKQAKHE